MRILSTLLFTCFFLTLSASTIVVCNECEYNDIEEAYNKSVDGDILEIHAGTYEVPNLVIEKKIIIRGKDSPVLISKDGGEILTIAKSGVIIEGLSFKGVMTNYLKENAAIRVRRCKNVIVRNNRIDDCFFAIYLEKVKNCFVEDNILDGDAGFEAESGNGIHAWYCDSLHISNNEIIHHRDGIYLEFVNFSEVNENHSHHNTRYGLHYMFSNDDTYTGNVLEFNGVGVAVMFSRRITMRNNYFQNNWGHAAYGLLLKEIYDAEILDNHFVQNTVGIFVEGSNRINYYGNEFRRNGWALKFSGGCESNTISDNEFLYNSIDLVVSSQINNNSFDNNYWSDYAGYDLDKDDIGDVPHYPVKLYSYIQNQVPESVVLMRSLFVDIINYAEKVSPIFTPKDVMDRKPKMSRKL